MAINETLKFSWGHIIAFVALILISYLSFMGIAYLEEGNFLKAGLGVVIIDMVLVLFFIVPQLLKGTEKKFKKRIWFERILVFLSPVVFYFMMSSYSHFWTVFKNRQQIETTFTESVKTTKNMFDSYEVYANERIKEYTKKLARAKTDEVSKNNKIEALKLQLIDMNYHSLKESAFDWIDEVTGVTVWNVFVIGNIDKTINAIDKWNNVLNEFSSKIMADESKEVEAFSASDPSVIAAKDNLNNLRTSFTLRGKPTTIAIILGIFFYLLLLFPYVIQRRNTKSTYRLIFSEGGFSFNKRRKNNKNTEKSDDIIIEDNEDNMSSDGGDYGSFTM
ncbi:MAG: hypothetical protein IJZ87_08785 [Bacteroidales bacterium]|nr:hypothetical protein [Bacteroidales bacterium]